jgi:molybdopterin-biosynthesis enzyme MoeA-like protein
LSWARYVGDERTAITAVLRDAFASGDAVFSCGGIGATPDDHTRQCAAAALGVRLELHQRAKELIQERMRDTAREQNLPFEPERPDNLHRLNMGVFPQGAEIIPNPYNKIPGFSVGDVHFVPGFPVMAHPMIEWLLDTRYLHLHGTQARRERSVIVTGSMEATLTPLMEAIEARFPGVKVFSLPSVDHPTLGRHIELGVKGEALATEAAFEALKAGLAALGVTARSDLVHQRPQ